MKAFQGLFAGIAAVALFAMMLLTFADVFSRKFLGGSITGAVELTELGMLTMIFFALPLASLAGEHIVFDLLDRVLPATMLRLQHTIANALTGAVFTGAALVVWQRADRTDRMGDVTATLEIRLEPFHRMVAVMLAATALVHLALALRHALRPPASPPAPAAAAPPPGAAR
jgi:TRAP-type C4-dicarboxylate transport system permease small subunit